MTWHTERLGVGFLAVEHRVDHGADLAFNVMGLVDHISDVLGGGAHRFVLALFTGGQFVVDQEKFIL